MRNWKRNKAGILIPDAPKLTDRFIRANEQMKGAGVYQWCHQRGEDFEWLAPEPNLVVDQGLVYMSGVGVLGTTQITNWYTTLYKNNYTPVAADDNTLANFTEITYSSGDVSQASRPAYTAAATATAGSFDNAASLAQFDITATFTAYGALICSAASGTTMTLLSAAKYGTGRGVVSGDILYVKYSFTNTST